MATDVLLIVPISRSHYVVPPLGLGYLATAVRRSAYGNIAILDCVKLGLSHSGLPSTIASMNPRLVGFQVFSSDVASVTRGIRIVREVAPNCRLIVGGPHVSARGPDSLQDFPEADFGLIGEGEIGLPMLVRRELGGDSIPLAGIPGLIWREGDGVRANERANIDDLDELGFPAWDLMPPATYPDAPQGAFYRQFPIAPMASSRGCPYGCAFCGSPVNMGRKLRLRSLGHVFAEMELLHKEYGVQEFHFVDDMFNASNRRVLEFCDILESKHWGVSYTFPNGLRLNTIDEEMLLRMKQTGAYSFTVGIESGSQRILDSMNKHLTVDMIRDKVNMISRAGLEPSGFFLLGFPGETKEDMMMTLRLAKELPLKRAHFSNFLPLPGTEATRRLLESGEIECPDWADLSYARTPYSPIGMTKEELKAFQRRAFLEFHLRPRILLNMLKEIRSPFHLFSLLKRARDYLFTPGIK